MNDIVVAILEPWPWYVAGPLIGLTVPLLLILGNKPFGISSSLRHICAACFPRNINFFKYDWRKEAWNLFFVGGILIGGVITSLYLSSGQPAKIDDNLRQELATYGIVHINSLVPEEIFNLTNLFSVQGFLLMVVGGLFVGFGTRYAGGCTSGHSIMGLSNFQLPSLIATCCFMAGGFIMANLILPYILIL